MIKTGRHRYEETNGIRTIADTARRVIYGAYVGIGVGTGVRIGNHVQKTIVRITTHDDLLVAEWGFNKPVNALTRIDEVFADKFPDIPTEKHYNVKLILGKDLKQDSVLNIENRLTIDLNGHAIVRTRDGKKKKDGEVILIKAGADLTVIDSNPEGPGYDGVPGGVITGGASTNTGGGIHVQERRPAEYDRGHDIQLLHEQARRRYIRRRDVLCHA